MDAGLRRYFLFWLASAAPLTAQSQPQDPPRIPGFDRDKDDNDERLPNGKSQKDAIAKREHEEALKDTEALIKLAEELLDELKHSGDFVVSISSVKKTAEIEKLAHRIRTKIKT